MKGVRKKIKLIVEKTDTGFSAFSGDLPIFTTGKTVAELLQNAKEATDLYFEDQKIEIGLEQIQFDVDFKQFFKYFKVLNARHLAEKIGMNPTLLSQYVQGHKKPSAIQTQKILQGIHQIGQELSEVNLIYNH